MKMILMLAGLSVLASSCFKKGCRDIDAINYNEKAKRNDHSCEYYTKVKVSSVTVSTFSSVNTSGLNWDTADDPDCFIRIKDFSNNIMHQSNFIENQSGPLTWTISPALTIEEFSGVTLQLRDYDASYTDGGSEKMVEALVPFTDYIGGNSPVQKEETGNYPSSFEFSEAGATFTFNVTWE
ncbi:MAG: hypothetical protein ABJG68_17325 [Crocinitomicaceae bacterium]